MRTIRRIAEDDQVEVSVREQEIHDYVLELFSTRIAGIPFSVAVSRRSDYYAIKVFVGDASKIDDAQTLGDALEVELLESGVRAFVYVQSWAGHLQPESNAA